MYISQNQKLSGGDTPDPLLQVHSIDDRNNHLINNLSISLKLKL